MVSRAPGIPESTHHRHHVNVTYAERGLLQQFLRCVFHSPEEREGRSTQ
jgi:hypothetical protein